jgi:hypothetical protein
MLAGMSTALLVLACLEEEMDGARLPNNKANTSDGLAFWPSAAALSGTRKVRIPD